MNIKNVKTGEVVPLAPTPEHKHPRWVHEQLGTHSELEIRMLIELYPHEFHGEDALGVQSEDARDPEILRARVVAASIALAHALGEHNKRQK